jgi:hypothetical protein
MLPRIHSDLGIPAAAFSAARGKPPPASGSGMFVMPMVGRRWCLLERRSSWLPTPHSLLPERPSYRKRQRAGRRRERPRRVRRVVADPVPAGDEARERRPSRSPVCASSWPATELERLAGLLRGLELGRVGTSAGWPVQLDPAAALDRVWHVR